jgi:hypothetical protein
MQYTHIAGSCIGKCKLAVPKPEFCNCAMHRFGSGWFDALKSAWPDKELPRSMWRK